MNLKQGCVLLCAAFSAACSNDEGDAGAKTASSGSPFVGTWTCGNHIFVSLGDNPPPGKQTVVVTENGKGKLLFTFSGSPAISETPVEASVSGEYVSFVSGGQCGKDHYSVSSGSADIEKGGLAYAINVCGAGSGQILGTCKSANPSDASDPTPDSGKGRYTINVSADDTSGLAAVSISGDTQAVKDLENPRVVFGFDTLLLDPPESEKGTAVFSGQRPTPESPFGIEFPPVALSGTGNEEGTITYEGQAEPQPLFGVGVVYTTADGDLTSVCQVGATDNEGGLRTDGKGNFELKTIVADSTLSNGFRITGSGHFEECPVLDAGLSVVGRTTIDVKFE